MSSDTSGLQVPAVDLHIDLDRLSDDLRGPGWSLHPGALAGGGCATIRQTARELREQGEFRPAGVGRGEAWRLDPALRGDEVMWLDRATAAPCLLSLLDRFEQIGLELNRRLFLGIVDYEAHLAVYPAGKAYRRHKDHFRGTASRIVTTTLYLNADWGPADGGQIRLFVPGAEPLEIPPAGGTLLVFLAQDFEHEVLPARRERWSWTGWYRCAEPVRR